ncbi:hypothetical protein T10_6307 [Trichinella papuae]|uniref:Uncharacterized protein n=1 Tax=Trichinella papuae TaxID=268474 RepID=A0A0V1M2R4_9BILA|nr:hypothetical protein T10_6307 [Trichinella papuae]
MNNPINPQGQHMPFFSFYTLIAITSQNINCSSEWLKLNGKEQLAEIPIYTKLRTDEPVEKYHILEVYYARKEV